MLRKVCCAADRFMRSAAPSGEASAAGFGGAKASFRRRRLRRHLFAEVYSEQTAVASLRLDRVDLFRVDLQRLGRFLDRLLVDLPVAAERAERSEDDMSGIDFKMTAERFA